MSGVASMVKSGGKKPKTQNTSYSAYAPITKTVEMVWWIATGRQLVL